MNGCKGHLIIIQAEVTRFYGHLFPKTTKPSCQRYFQITNKGVIVSKETVVLQKKATILPYQLILLYQPILPYQLS